MSDDTKIRKLKQELAAKQIIIDNLKASIKRPKVIKQRKARPSLKSEFIRVIIPDTHGSNIDKSAESSLLEDLKGLNPKEIVLLGDHVDCGGWLAQHHTLGYVAETNYSYFDDINAANNFLDSIQKLAPRAEIHYLEGNHEARVEKWCVTQALRHTKDSDELRKLISPEFCLRLKDRGIKYYRQSERYNGLRVPGCIKLGKCHFWHGTSTAKQAATINAQQIGGNIVYGHTHRADSHTASNVASGEFGAWCPGFLGKIQPYWQHSKPTGWSHGYAVQLVSKSGQFLHINVPIVDGISLLSNLIRRN